MLNIKKIFICLAISFLFFFSFAINTRAASITNVNNGIEYIQPAEACGTCSGADGCTSIFGDPECDQCPAYWLQFAFDIIKYVAIVALFVLVLVDFFKALVASDNKALTKAAQTAVKRFIFCVIIFFLPTLVELIMELFGAYGTCGIR